MDACEAMDASRIANVSVMLWSADRDADWQRVAALAARIFEEVIVVDGNVDPLAALESAQGERILLVESPEAASVCAETMLALVSWPEAAVVQPVDDAGHRLPFSIHRRAALLARGLPLAADSNVERVSLARLGVDDAPHPLFVGPEVA